MNRVRRIASLLTALMVVLVLSACSGNPQTASSPSGDQKDGDFPTGPVKLTMFVFAAPGHKDVPREVVDRYMQEHKNVEIEIVESSNAKVMPQMLAAHKTTPDQPYIHLGYFNLDSTMQGMINGLWDSLDPKNIPNLERIPEKFRMENNLGVQFAYGPYGLIYNTEKVKTPPTSYADLWSNDAFKGRVALWDYQFAPIVMAARANGGGENNIEPGIKAFADNADQIHTLVTSNEQLKNAIAAGDVWLAFFDLQQATKWKEEGAPIGLAVPKEGAIAWPLYIQVVKGLTPDQKRVAEDLVNELIATDVLAKYAEGTYYVPTAEGVPLSDKLKSLPSFQPDVQKNALVLDFLTMAQMKSPWSQIWDREVKTKLSR